MGVLAVPNLGGLAYGVARGTGDAIRLGMEEDAHKADQAIRTKRLENETELQPLRTRALELGVEEAERTAARRPQIEKMEDDLRGLNLDIAKLTKKEKERAWDRLQEAQRREGILNEGLRTFFSSADPQSVVDAVEKMQGDEIPEERRGAKATRGEDGSITLQVPGAQPQVFRAQKDKAGNLRSADDYFGMFAVKMLNPVERLKTDLSEEYNLAKEAERTERALGVARERGAATRDAAETRAGAISTTKSQAWYSRQHNQIKGVLDSMLKPESSPSGFAAAYAFDSDKALRGKIEEMVENEIEQNGTPVRQAANKTINEVRKSYDLLDKKAKQHAAALAKAKIKPADRAAVEKAAEEGNADAKELLKTLGVAEKHLGSSVAKYLEQQLPTK